MSFDELVAILASLGNEEGEAQGLSELDHGLQCAYALASTHADDLEIQAAGLVHDIGHLFGSDEDHGRVGAAMVCDVLGPRVAALVEAHVPAKRYLVTTDPAYLESLSELSTHTLGLQGGPMSEEEVAAYMSGRAARDAVELRRADEGAKVVGCRVPPLEYWIERLEAVSCAEPGTASRKVP